MNHFTFHRIDDVYSKGSSGDGVRRLQQALSCIGFDIEVDGIYGSRTKEIVMNIQKKFPELSPDGIFSPTTRLYIDWLLNIDYHVVKEPDNILVLVNKLNTLPHNYTPRDLVVPEVPFDFEGFQPKRQMRHEAACALEQLFMKSAEEEVNFIAASGYRSYERQAEIFSEKFRNSPINAVKFSARPGESEHQTGLAVDLTCAAAGYELVQEFSDTPEGRWLTENAQDFGFIVRYPKGKESITGYQYEPWHIRYVGVPAAREIWAKRLTLEEYLKA